MSANLQTRYVLGKDNREDSTNFLRIKIPNGRLTARQFRQIADLSKTHGRGYAEITDRQNIQLHWINPQNAQEIFTKLDSIGFSTDHGGQGIPTASHGDVRAIISCPAAGFDRDEIADAMPIVKEIDAFFDGNTDFLDMPRKFKIGINTCSQNCSNPETQDISFTAVLQPSGEVGFVVYVGGTVAAVPKLARPLNVVVSEKDILPVAHAVAQLFRDNMQREIKAKARFRYLVDSWGTEKLRAEIEAKLGRKLQTYTGNALTGRKAEHVGVQPQKQQGYSFITVPLAGGVLSTKKMLELAGAAEMFGDGTICLTPYQNLIIANVPDSKIPAAKSRLSEIGYPIEGPYLKWATIACAGNFCGKTLDHPKNRAKEAVEYLQVRFGSRLNAVVANVGFSGCPNGCARHLTADVGFQGTTINVDGKSVAAFNVYVKAPSETPTLGTLVARGVPAKRVKFALANLIEAYLGSGSHLGFTVFLGYKSAEEIAAIIAA